MMIHGTIPGFRRPTSVGAQGGAGRPSEGDEALIARIRATSRRFSAVAAALARADGSPLRRRGRGGALSLIACLVRSLVAEFVSRAIGVSFRRRAKTRSFCNSCRVWSSVA